MAKPRFQTLVIDPKAFHEVMVMPHFGDVIGENGTVVIPSDEEGDWMVIDDVPHTRPVIEIVGSKNLLKRRDTTCKIIRSSLGTVSARYIKTEKVYISAENCQQELYQGAFRDWESRSDVFREKAIEIIMKAFGTDSFTNKWFGKEGRAANADWSLNKYNGIWTWLNKYRADGVIPAAQTISIPVGEISEADAYGLMQDLIDNQDDILYHVDDSDKAIYVDKKLAKKVWRYLVSVGDATPAQKAQGTPSSFYIEDTEVRVKKWNPVLKAIASDAAIATPQHTYAACLTLKGQFLYATDSKYGKGPNNDGPAMKVWYDEDDDVTRYEIHHKGGTELSAPKHSVIAMTNGLSAVL